MLQGQPKGLYALALANTGERFGYYTMLAIFTLFLQAKFGYTAAETSTIFASFLAFVYFMPLIGGMMADKFGYGKMVTSGIIIMFVGYLLLAIPTDAASGKIMMFGSLALIACGTGLFKGNLQVMVIFMMPRNIEVNVTKPLVCFIWRLISVPCTHLRLPRK